MQTFLENYSLLAPAIAYLAIFLGVVIEGDVVLFTSAFLAAQHVLDPLTVIELTILGVFLRDIFWFEIGKIFYESDSKISKWAHKIAEPFDDHLEDGLVKSLCIAKFVYGLHLAIVMRIGALKIPVREFIRADILATAIWIVVVGGLGYFANASLEALEVERYLKYTEASLAIVVVFFILFHSAVSSLSKRTLRSKK